MSRLTSPTHVKRFALDCVAQRPGINGKITRVSQDFLDRVEANTRAYIANHIANMPSAGKTIQ